MRIITYTHVTSVLISSKGLFIIYTQKQIYATHTPTQAPINIPPTPPTPSQSIASRCWPVEISRWRGILNSTSHPLQWWRRCSRRGTAGWEQGELGGWRADGHALHGTGRGSATDQSTSKLVSQLINFKTLPQICQWTSQSTNYLSTASNLSANKSVN